MMENERRWAIKEMLQKEQEQVAKRLQFAKILKEQIIENEEHRILEFERKREESRLINLSNIAWQQEEIEKLRNKEAENAKVRQELAEVNEQLKYFKAMEEEENKIIDLRYFTGMFKPNIFLNYIFLFHCVKIWFSGYKTIID